MKKSSLFTRVIVEMVSGLILTQFSCIFLKQSNVDLTISAADENDRKRMTAIERRKEEVKELEEKEEKEKEKKETQSM